MHKNFCHVYVKEIDERISRIENKSLDNDSLLLSKKINNMTAQKKMLNVKQITRKFINKYRSSGGGEKPSFGFMVGCGGSRGDVW